MITWIKPNGNEITTNDMDATIEYMESIGCKRKGAKKENKPEVKKATKKGK